MQQLSADDTRETTNLKTKEIPNADRSTVAKDVRTFNISTNEIEDSICTSEYYKNDHPNFKQGELINNYALVESQDMNLANECEDDSSITIEDNNDGVSC